LFTLGALAGEGNSVKIIPDSTNTFAQFEISRIRKSIYKIKFTNEKGQVLDQRKEEISESPKLIAFNWKGLQPGIYFVTLENKHEELKLMFIRQLLSVISKNGIGKSGIDFVSDKFDLNITGLL
jgi:hypothetical protein